MDLKEIGLVELSYEEVIDIDGGGLLSALTTAAAGLPPLLILVNTARIGYLAAILTALLVPIP